VPAEASVPAVAARVKKAWIKKARRRLKKVLRSADIIQIIRATLRKNPGASVEQVRCEVEQVARCSFAAGAKYKFFYHQLFKILRTVKHTRPRRTQPRKFSFHDDVGGSAPAASWRTSGREEAFDCANDSVNEDQAPAALVPWLAP